MEQLKELLKEVEKKNNEPARKRSAWSRGVGVYALELVESLEDCEKFPQNKEELKKALLNGARDWAQYSWGGCSLIYNGDICERLATPSEQKRTNNGEKNPSSQEEWLDTQARALFQASNRVIRAYNNLHI